MGKIGDTYQAYCNMFKSCTMATHHGGSGCPLNRDIEVDSKAQDTDDVTSTQIKAEGPAHFEDPKYDNPTKLTNLTR